MRHNDDHSTQLMRLHSNVESGTVVIAFVRSSLIPIDGG